MMNRVWRAGIIVGAAALVTLTGALVALAGTGAEPLCCSGGGGWFWQTDGGIAPTSG